MQYEYIRVVLVLGVFSTKCRRKEGYIIFYEHVLTQPMILLVLLNVHTTHSSTTTYST